MEDYTEVEETSVETTEEVEDVREMSDDEFDNFMDDESAPQSASADAEDTPEAKGDKEVEVDLEALYHTQIEDKESSIDKPLLIKINGKTHEISNVDEMRNLMERGLGATQKMQAIAEHRKTIEFLSDNGISQEDLNQLLSNRGEEPVEVDQGTKQVQGIAEGILSSTYADDFRDTASMLPQGIQEEMKSNPQLLNDFYGDVQTGIAQKIMPKVERLMSVNNMSFYQAYGQAGKEFETNTQQTDSKVQTLKSQPRSNSQSLNQNDQDIWSMSDSDFDKYMA